MHAIVDIRTRVIIDYLVTDSVTADINGLYVMLHRLGLGMGMFCLDSAYLAREMCDMISAMSMVPRIKPSSAQRQGKPDVARDGRLVHGRQGDIRLRVPPAAS